MITYIYILQHPETKEIKYVGKTTNIKRRKYQHFNKKIASNLKNKHLGNWILNLLNINKKPDILVIEEVVENWEDREKYWIKFYSQINKLCNITSGGEGCSKPCSEETKIKISEAQKGVPKSFSEKGLESLRNRFLYDNPRNNPLFRQKWIENNKNSKNSCKTEEFRNLKREQLSQQISIIGAPRSKPIIQYDLQNNIIKEWNSVKEASDTLKIRYCSIISCCKNKLKSYKNYVWKYK